MNRDHSVIFEIAVVSAISVSSIIRTIIAAVSALRSSFLSASVRRSAFFDHFLLFSADFGAQKCCCQFQRMNAGFCFKSFYCFDGGLQIGTFHHLAHFIQHSLFLMQTNRTAVGHTLFFQFCLADAFNFLNLVQLTDGCQRKGHTFLSGSSGSADSIS